MIYENIIFKTSDIKKQQKVFSIKKVLVTGMIQSNLKISAHPSPCRHLIVLDKHFHIYLVYIIKLCCGSEAAEAQR